MFHLIHENTLTGAIKVHVTKLHFQKVPLYQSAKPRKNAKGIQTAGIILVDSHAGDV